MHAGYDLPTALANLETYATQVRDLTVGSGHLPIGLWLSENAVSSVLLSDRTRELRDWLAERRFVPYTFNGFPQGNFHRHVVKHAVYEPTWTCQSRAGYTKSLAQIMEAILPAGCPGSISTLPLGWPHAPWHAETYSCAAEQLLDVARYLDRLTQQRGCEIVVAIEPEPGCVLDSADDIVEFFEHYLLRGADAELARRHLTVCHDICHSGVMFEPQQQALAHYLKAGLRIGKVQVSSAIHVPWNDVAGEPERQRAMLRQVQSFSEPKYLHQTTRCNATGRLQDIVEDLPIALQRWSVPTIPTVPWRIHFHVPIFLEDLGNLATTRADIATACRFLETHRTQQIAGRDWFTGHYEVETYAWSVLPAELAASDLARAIAQELEYFDSILCQTIASCR